MGQVRHTRRAAAALAVAALVSVVASCAPAPRYGISEPGQPGASGPCGSTQHALHNSLDGRHELSLFEPTGSATPSTGGTCDDSTRPVALIAHGYFGFGSVFYQGLIDHLVSNGYLVVFSAYTPEPDPPHQYAVVDRGLVQAVESTDRADTSRIGVVGHSFGAGMTPWLVQQSAARGWGTAATWAVMFAPAYPMFVGQGPIEMPDNARVTVVNYSDDVLVDARIGIELYQAMVLPVAAKTHVMLRTDISGTPGLYADHLGPLSVEFVPFLTGLSSDHYDDWSWRAIDATAGCALAGRWCDTDLSFTGRWPDGHAVRPALVSTDPQDLGPPAMLECGGFDNIRPCPD